MSLWNWPLETMRVTPAALRRAGPRRQRADQRRASAHVTIRPRQLFTNHVPGDRPVHVNDADRHEPGCSRNASTNCSAVATKRASRPRLLRALRMRDPKSRSRFKTTASVGLDSVVQSWLNSAPLLASSPIDTRNLGATASRILCYDRSSVYPDSGTIASRHRIDDAADRSVPRGENEGRQRVRTAASSRLHDAHRTRAGGRQWRRGRSGSRLLLAPLSAGRLRSRHGGSNAALLR